MHVFDLFDDNVPCQVAGAVESAAGTSHVGCGESTAALEWSSNSSLHEKHVDDGLCPVGEAGHGIHRDEVRDLCPVD
eukprot:7784623-Karenia_brevis.AAC.1